MKRPFAVSEKMEISVANRTRISDVTRPADHVPHKTLEFQQS
jgi:hypothetical protein